ncbi:hypothetical protein NQ317_018562 [Molorchus minor]|uniref:Uncharacterized protein n=1 Tax=Molorchus minor TaxID=1323400 RepID=A0ABQ9JW19_9CUCU|nr:hypothetical protein NQ317_018562 [Molorchus minor]
MFLSQFTWFMNRQVPLLKKVLKFSYWAKFNPNLVLKNRQIGYDWNPSSLCKLLVDMVELLIFISVTK